MKKIFLVLMLYTVLIFTALSQPVSDYIYKLDNGITVKTEHCWNQVWVQQSYAPISAADKTPLSVNIRTLGDLISSSSYKLQLAGKDVKMQGAVPGSYDLKLTFKLSGTPGTLSFLIRNVVIKPKNKTSVSVTLYDYQILIDEKPVSLAGLSQYETLINRCKGYTIQDIYTGTPSFYQPGNHEKPLTPTEVINKTTGKIKPGTYDLLISIGISDQTQKVWLNNFIMKPDISYKISTNLNAGSIIYTGGNKDVNSMSLYPAGTAARQTGIPAPVKNLATISYGTVSIANCCSPGTYDVLLNFKNGSKYEWRKNVVIQTGIRTEVK